jgi:hypothetical protein
MAYALQSDDAIANAASVAAGDGRRASGKAAVAKPNRRGVA